MQTIGPGTLLRIPVFIAALVALGVTLAGRLAWTAWPFELVTNFPVQVGAMSVVIGGAAVFLRARTASVLAGLALVINIIVISGLLFGDPRAAASGTRVSVGHLNAQTRHIDVPALGRYLTAKRVDVFIVLDPIQSDIPALTRAAPGFRVWRVGSGRFRDSDFVRVIVLSRTAVDHVRHPADPGFGRTAVELTIQTEPTAIELVAFGTDAPTTPARANTRDRALNAAARWSIDHPDRRVVMGDFNATPWSPSFHRLVRDGDLFDSLSGYGLQVSWPESNPLLRIPIDHLLLGPALATTHRGTGPSFGSQHRSLQATLAPAA